MRAAIDECTVRWPGRDQAGSPVDSPWASWPLAADEGLRVVEINIRYQYADVMLAALIGLAERNEIVLCDPQEDEVHLPPRLRQRD